MGKYSTYQDIDEEEVEESNESIIPLLSIISKWFIRIGIVIGVILLVYFITIGKFMSAFLFLLGLIVSYFFGYFFMFCLDRLTAMND